MFELQYPLVRSATDRDEYIAMIGANLPFQGLPPCRTIQLAIDAIALQVEAIAVSRTFLTPCVPTGWGPDYYNTAVAFRSAEDPQRILEKLHVIEAEFSRKRTSRWQSRTLDIDLIACGSLVLPDVPTLTKWMDIDTKIQMPPAPSELILPHPRMHERAFVLVPVCDIRPGWTHPTLGQSARQLMLACNTEGIEAYPNSVICD